MNSVLPHKRVDGHIHIITKLWIHFTLTLYVKILRTVFLRLGPNQLEMRCEICIDIFRDKSFVLQSWRSLSARRCLMLSRHVLDSRFLNHIQQPWHSIRYCLTYHGASPSTVVLDETLFIENWLFNGEPLSVLYEPGCKVLSPVTLISKTQELSHV